jgi:hypothetical protein
MGTRGESQGWPNGAKFSPAARISFEWDEPASGSVRIVGGDSRHKVDTLVVAVGSSVDWPAALAKRPGKYAWRVERVGDARIATRGEFEILPWKRVEALTAKLDRELANEPTLDPDRRHLARLILAREREGVILE